ncbi:MAG: hypothetical protein ACXAC8_12335 [Candidatus Hodarchaeales archaeon]
MSIWRRIFRIDPQNDFSKGREAFTQKQYNLAFKLFKKAYQRFDTIDMKLLSLDNAAVSAEQANMYEKACNLYYQAICLKMQIEVRPKELISELDRSLRTAKLSKKSPISLNKLLFMKFLVYLSLKDFNQLKSFYNKMKFNDLDIYAEAIKHTWTLIHSTETLEIKEQIPMLDLPEEFLPIFNKAELVMQRCSLCEVILDRDEKSEPYQKGNEFSLNATLTAHSKISISKINLKIGTRGRIIASSMAELPLNMSTGENYSIVFSLIPNLPGKWELGPLSIEYSIPSETGEFPVVSNVISINVNDAPPSMKLFMDSIIVEEDLEYIVRITAENTGKTALQNIKIVTEIPDDVKIHEGTNEKYISALGEGELFQYEILLKFSLDQSHLSGHIIRANGFIEDNKRLSKSSIKIGGS